jgi:hypothetical protein
MPSHSPVEIAAPRFIYVKLPSAQTRSHISTTAETNERTIPSDVIVIGQSRASRRKPSGTEDALMTPHRLLFCFVGAIVPQVQSAGYGARCSQMHEKREAIALRAARLRGYL